MILICRTNIISNWSLCVNYPHVRGGLQSHLMCRGLGQSPGLIEQKVTVNIYKSGCGRAGGQGWVLLRPPHTGPDWIIRNELANVTNVTSITRLCCVTEAAWHWDDTRRILKHISVLWPQGDQTWRRVSGWCHQTPGARVWRNVWDWPGHQMSSGLRRHTRSWPGVSLSGRSHRCLISEIDSKGALHCFSAFNMFIKT